MAPKRFKKIYIEISNVCNLQCDFCPEVERDKKIMGPELFEKIVGEAAPLTEEVCFHLMGEPLTHPRFSQYLDICAAHQVPVNITSNGLLLNEEKTQALLKPIVRQVNFSLHSFDSNFPGQDNSSYLEKIFSFTRRAFEERPDLYINYRLWNLTEDSGKESSNTIILRALEKEFGVSINSQVHVDWKKSKNVTGRLYLHFDSRFDWPNLKDPLRSQKGFCHGLSSHMAIHADGTVVPCCLDKEAGVNLGNCQSHSVESIVDGDRARGIAEGFRSGRLIEDLCQRCTFIERFTKPTKIREWSA